MSRRAGAARSGNHQRDRETTTLRDWGRRWATWVSSSQVQAASTDVWTEGSRPPGTTTDTQALMVIRTTGGEKLQLEPSLRRRQSWLDVRARFEAQDVDSDGVGTGMRALEGSHGG